MADNQDFTGIENIGVLGGTFDPVHLGHLMMAEEARKALDLSKVLLVPAGRPMSKPIRRITSVKYRLAMVRLAAEGRSWLEVDTMELERPGPSYTADTIAQLRSERKVRGEIYFILGWDSLLQLPEWHEPARLVSLCRLAAVPRPGQLRPDLAVLEKVIPGISDRVVFLEKPCVDISASAIREMIGRNESVDGLVPPRVADYIKRRELYIPTGGMR